MSNRDEIVERLQNVFRDVFDDDEIIITDSTTASDIEDWDSKEHINLIVSAEQEFGLRFAIAEISELPNVGSLVDLIHSKISS